ncbi:MAG: hypothetical protein Q8O67_26215 [Deltaproteobacteria bacterium]|nr:hypothetical protein [Deltaproteobacteria bacterium]
MTDALMQVSVDDRRALWALTTRHLRSRTFGAVLLVRAALRAHATNIEVSTRGNRLRVVDDGSPRSEELAAIVTALRTPDVHALHALEARFGTDLLVAVATAEHVSIETGGRAVVVKAGVVVADAPAHDRARLTTVIELARSAALRKEERRELTAWLPSPRARVVVDGKRWGSALALPEGCFSARNFRTARGRGLIAFALGESTSRITVLGRGLWVAQDHRRPRGLPIVAVWDDDDIVSADAALLRARTAVDAANAALLARVAEEFERLPRARRVQLRSLLLRSGGTTLPTAFEDVPLFDDDSGAFQLSLRDLRARDARLIIGKSNADVVVDAESAAFLHRALPGMVKDALPPPRRRLAFALQLRVARLKA